MRRYLVVVTMAIALAGACTAADARQKELRDLFLDLQPLVHDLPRYRYLVKAMPDLSPADQLTARQMLAFTEDELGLYSEAVRDFPLHNRQPPELLVPRATDWQAVDAIDTITELARSHRIVMVNEAHHDAHTRELTLALLPRLRAIGFTHFAAEALSDRDTALMQRGYPVISSGSEYLHEPLYGDIVREAIKLGFVIVPYDSSGATPQEREDEQARHLYERVLAKDPKARLFVHAGYAHIDKQPGRLGTVRPMAMELSKLSGIEPLSIDQTDIREDAPRSESEAHEQFEHALQRFETLPQPMRAPLGTGPGDVAEKPAMDTYHQIVDTFPSSHAIVLRKIGSHTFWSARPGTYDFNVILPPANPVYSSYAQGPIRLSIDGKRYPVLPPASGGKRPDWLTLDGQRVPVPIDTSACARKAPCLIEAHYAGEPDDAIAADRYFFLEQKATNQLYLRPGVYRLRSANIDNRTLREWTVTVPAAPQG